MNLKENLKKLAEMNEEIKELGDKHYKLVCERNSFIYTNRLHEVDLKWKKLILKKLLKEKKL